MVAQELNGKAHQSSFRISGGEVPQPDDVVTGQSVYLQDIHGAAVGLENPARHGTLLLLASARLAQHVAAVQGIGAQLNRELAALTSECAALAIMSIPRVTAPAPAASSHALSPRQCQVARRLAAGASDQEIALTLGISLSTTKTHVRSVLTTLGLRSRRELLHVLPASFFG